MTVVSVDLAHRQYRDVGVALLDVHEGAIRCAFHEIALTGQPSPSKLAEYLAILCAKRGANILLLDGPQGWKHPDNGLTHSRICERALNTPAKTGLPETVKPANYASFVRFSIKVFASLIDGGWALFSGTRTKASKTVIESFPLSAWRSLGIRALPAKSKARPSDIDNRLAELVAKFPLVTTGSPNHDQLQALVSGLAGIWFAVGNQECVAVAGRVPQLLDGHWREGFIVNPVGPPDRRAVGPS